MNRTDMYDEAARILGTAEVALDVIECGDSESVPSARPTIETAQLRVRIAQAWMDLGRNAARTEPIAIYE